MNRFMAPLRNTAGALETSLFAPVDISSLVVFRICFGALMFWEVCRYEGPDWIRRYYIDPVFHFNYPGFEWVVPWPGDGMFLHFDVLGAVTLCILFGFAYRISSALFFLGFSYVFLLDQARYLNHFYLVCLVSLLMVFVPAHRSLSVDAWLDPRARSSFAPAWSLWLLRTQLGIVYFYGGLAKLNWDWLQGWPLRLWFANRTDTPVLGPFLGDPIVAVLAAYAGLAIDLLAFPLMLKARSRPVMFSLLATFHLLNATLFSIGIFPWLSLAMTLLFFPPDWPRRLLRLVGRERKRYLPTPVPAANRSILAALFVYLLLQLTIPLRHWLYPGDVAWTEEGHRFSWRMKLRDKEGFVKFYVRDPSTRRRIPMEWRELLTDWQYQEMATRPDMIAQFARYLNNRVMREGRGPVEVTVRALVSLNGRRREFLIDPEVNLAAQDNYTFQRAPYVVPLAPSGNLSSSRAGH